MEEALALAETMIERFGGCCADDLTVLMSSDDNVVALNRCGNVTEAVGVLEQYTLQTVQQQQQTTGVDGDPYVKKLWPVHIRKRTQLHYVPSKFKRKFGHSVVYSSVGGFDRIHNNYALSLSAFLAKTLDLALVCVVKEQVASHQIASVFGLKLSQVRVQVCSLDGSCFSRLVKEVSEFDPHLLIVQERYQVSRVHILEASQFASFAVIAVDCDNLIPPFYAEHLSASEDEMRLCMTKVFPPTIQTIPMENVFKFGCPYTQEAAALEHLELFLQNKNDCNLAQVCSDVDQGYLSNLLVLREAFNHRRHSKFGDRVIWERLVETLLIRRECQAMIKHKQLQ